MGLLTEGTPLTWQDTKQYSPHVRKHAATQFVCQYKKQEGRSGDPLLWGEEVEYQIIKFDHAEKKARVHLKAATVLPAIKEKLQQEKKQGAISVWVGEYTSFQLESTPGAPYGQLVSDMTTVQSNMEQRRSEVEQELGNDEAAFTLTSFPRLGCQDFCSPPSVPDASRGLCRSYFLPDEILNRSHGRYPNLEQNFRERRQDGVSINVPIFKDVNTPSPFNEDLSSLIGLGGPSTPERAKDDHVFLDSPTYAMSNCCLQTTFQGTSLREAKSLYDSLAVLAPIMLALSAATPFQRGYLLDTDNRWSIIAQGCDERTEEEKGHKPLRHDRFVIPQSRCGSISCYLSPEGQHLNDSPVVVDRDVLDTLLAGGVDEATARHVAHILIRDSMCLFEEKLHVDDNNSLEHYENINSTVYQTVRFKPPPVDTDIGWRVELRTMDIQMTDFENAAYAVFVALMRRIILKYNLNILIPISKLDENTTRAYKRDAVLSEKFHFCTDIYSDPGRQNQPESECCLMTVDEILHGKDDYPGFLPLIQRYLREEEVDMATRGSLHQYLTLLSLRASGDLHTTARWMRNFISSHPDYKKDSVVSGTVSYDLLHRMDQVSRGKVLEPSLLVSGRKKASAYERNSQQQQPSVPGLDCIMDGRHSPSSHRI